MCIEGWEGLGARGQKLGGTRLSTEGPVCGRCTLTTDSRYPLRTQPCHPAGQTKPTWKGFQANPKLSLITLVALSKLFLKLILAATGREA